MTKILTMIYFLLLATLFINTAIAEDSTWKQSYELEQKGDFKTAAQLIQPFLQSEGDTKEFAHLRYAWLSYRSRQYNTALKYYQLTLDDNPQSIEAQMGISMVLSQQLRWKESSIQIHKVLQLAPFHMTANKRLMQNLTAERRWKELEQQALKLHKTYPSQTVLLLSLARAQAWRGKKQMAIKSYQSILLRDPDNAEAIIYLNTHAGQ